MATTTVDTPADTTMMRIVHDALRRDLARARDTLTQEHGVTVAQRRAIAAHLSWLMRFLHAHHESEDAGLYRLTRDRAFDAPDELEVLDRMSADHQAIAPAMAALESAASALGSDPSEASTRSTVEAIADLEALLLPHLRTEEDEAMPIVARRITDAEWHALEHEHNLDPKSMADLGFEGHWLIDGAAPGDRATVLGLVPPIPRFILLHGFARRYRRHAAASWGPAGSTPRRVQAENDVSVTVDADIDAVWDVVRDVTRVGEWSHECVGAEWLGGATVAVPGARFRGRNRAGVFRWGRVCEVVRAAPFELVFRTVPTALYPDSSEWTIALERVDGGRTRISERFRVVRAPKVLAVLYALVIPAHRDRTAGLIGDLERLGAVAGSAVPPTATAPSAGR